MNTYQVWFTVVYSLQVEANNGAEAHNAAHRIWLESQANSKALKPLEYFNEVNIKKVGGTNEA